MSPTSALVGSGLTLATPTSWLKFSALNSFSYYYDNALAGNLRVLSDLSIGPEYFNLSINEFLSGRYKTIDLSLQPRVRNSRVVLVAAFER